MKEITFFIQHGCIKLIRSYINL